MCYSNQIFKVSGKTPEESEDINMTNDEARKNLEAKLKCMEKISSGTDKDCNNQNCEECDLCYQQGNIGEQKESIRVAIESLKRQKVGKWTLQNDYHKHHYGWYYCSECGAYIGEPSGALYCSCCGSKMEVEE